MSEVYKATVDGQVLTEDQIRQYLVKFCTPLKPGDKVRVQYGFGAEPFVGVIPSASVEGVLRNQWRHVILPSEFLVIGLLNGECQCATSSNSVRLVETPNGYLSESALREGLAVIEQCKGPTRSDFKPGHTYSFKIGDVVDTLRVAGECETRSFEQQYPHHPSGCVWGIDSRGELRSVRPSQFIKP